MRSLLLLIPGVAMALTVGEPLPLLRGQFLDGEAAVLPEAAQGKVALLAFGFTYDSRFAVEAWSKRFRSEFGKDSRATFFEIPMIGGMARMGRWFIDSGMRRGTPKEDYRHVITVYGGTGPWKERFGYRDPKWAYLILLDPSGKVAWRHSGMFDDAVYADLARVSGQLLAAKK
ncbi:MAG: hypothetical protein ACKV22_00655 [Bryobacteraceae bacterium]